MLIGYQEADMDSEKKIKRSTQYPNRREAELRRSNMLMRRLLLGFKGRLDDELRARNVTTAQLRFLTEVKEKPGSTGAQVARACYMTPQSAQAMLARAVERGWVVRGTNAENHRLVTARLTPAGERLLEYADGVLARFELEVWNGVSMSDLKTMNGLLERGLDNIEGPPQE
jgi:MarR family transcriptional regulator, organic hydroperoxide resistance regulator